MPERGVGATARNAALCGAGGAATGAAAAAAASGAGLLPPGNAALLAATFAGILIGLAIGIVAALARSPAVTLPAGADPIELLSSPFPRVRVVTFIALADSGGGVPATPAALAAMKRQQERRARREARRRRRGGSSPGRSPRGSGDVEGGAGGSSADDWSETESTLDSARTPRGRSPRGRSPRRGSPRGGAGSSPRRASPRRVSPRTPRSDGDSLETPRPDPVAANADGNGIDAVDADAPVPGGLARLLRALRAALKLLRLALSGVLAGGVALRRTARARAGMSADTRALRRLQLVRYELSHVLPADPHQALEFLTLMLRALRDCTDITGRSPPGWWHDPVAVAETSGSGAGLKVPPQPKYPPDSEALPVLARSAMRGAALAALAELLLVCSAPQSRTARLSRDGRSGSSKGRRAASGAHPAASPPPGTSMPRRGGAPAVAPAVAAAWRRALAAAPPGAPSLSDHFARLRGGAELRAAAADAAEAADVRAAAAALLAEAAAPLAAAQAEALAFLHAEFVARRRMPLRASQVGRACAQLAGLHVGDGADVADAIAELPGYTGQARAARAAPALAAAEAAARAAAEEEEAALAASGAESSRRHRRDSVARLQRRPRSAAEASRSRRPAPVDDAPDLSAMMTLREEAADVMRRAPVAAAAALRRLVKAPHAPVLALGSALLHAGGCSSGATSGRAVARAGVGCQPFPVPSEEIGGALRAYSPALAVETDAALAAAAYAGDTATPRAAAAVATARALLSALLAPPPPRAVGSAALLLTTTGGRALAQFLTAAGAADADVAFADVAPHLLPLVGNAAPQQRTQDGNSIAASLSQSSEAAAARRAAAETVLRAAADAVSRATFVDVLLRAALAGASHMAVRFADSRSDSRFLPNLTLISLSPRSVRGRLRVAPARWWCCAAACCRAVCARRGCCRRASAAACCPCSPPAWPRRRPTCGLPPRSWRPRSSRRRRRRSAAAAAIVVMTAATTAKTRIQTAMTSPTTTMKRMRRRRRRRRRRLTRARGAASAASAATSVRRTAPASPPQRRMRSSWRRSPTSPRETLTPRYGCLLCSCVCLVDAHSTPFCCYQSDVGGCADGAARAGGRRHGARVLAAVGGCIRPRSRQRLAFWRPRHAAVPPRGRRGRRGGARGGAGRRRDAQLRAGGGVGRRHGASSAAGTAA